MEGLEVLVDWYQVKLFIEHGSGVSMDALHVVIGVFAQLLVAAVCRTSVSRWLPWLAVLAIEVLNEANDFRVETWPDWGMQWGEGIKDVALTMALPTLLLLVARLKPELFVRRARQPDPADCGQVALDCDKRGS